MILPKRTQRSGDHRGHGNDDEERRTQEQRHHRGGHTGEARV